MATEVLLKNARLIDGLRDAPLEKASVLIRGDRIAAVEAGDIPAPQAAQVIDLTGKTLTPGLIDTHVHTVMIGDEGLSLFMANGITSVRDCGAKLELVVAVKRALESGAKFGPRLYFCGPLLDGAQSSLPGAGGTIMTQNVASRESIPGVVKPILDAGADCLKLYFGLTADMGEAIIRFADGQVPITGHIGYMRASEAVKAGINGLEHISPSVFNDVCPAHLRFGPGTSMAGRQFVERLRAGWLAADFSAPDARALIDAMARRQVAMGTTMNIYWLFKAGYDAAARDPDRRYIVPKILAGRRETAAAQGKLSDPDWDLYFSRLAPEVIDQERKALEKQQEFCRRLFEAGGLIVGGTDAAINYPPAGFSLMRELELLADSIGTMNALRAVTSKAAIALRKQDDIGAVAPGRFADMVVVEGDPLEDITRMRNVAAVFKGGMSYDPKAILKDLPVNPNYPAA
ncbi:MAG TPA: amidohydrolase family protein [Candidatus Binataceae bacterium]|nr:amidohydrolase family protein [Candidatus Binataceae bacterium]